jgi:hypothetical protein
MGALQPVIAAAIYVSASGAAGTCAVFIVVPMIGIAGIERAWFKLGASWSRSLATTVLSVPLGIMTYLVTAFVGLVLGVNLGISSHDPGTFVAEVNERLRSRAALDIW